MKYTIVKQVIGEVDIKHFESAEEMERCISAICWELCEEGIRYKTHRVYQDRWGGILLHEVHTEDGCIYSVFKNETNE